MKFLLHIQADSFLYIDWNFALESFSFSNLVTEQFAFFGTNIHPSKAMLCKTPQTSFTLLVLKFWKKKMNWWGLVNPTKNKWFVMINVTFSIIRLANSGICHSSFWNERTIYTQFGTAYQSDNSFVRLTYLIENESKGCVSLSYWNLGQISS